LSQLSLIPQPKPFAIFSPCMKHADCELDCLERWYRYTLRWPTGNPVGKGTVLWALANPSTATHLKIDRTVARCIDYGWQWEYGWSGVVNARAWRETDSDLVPADPIGIGPDNDEYVFSMAKEAQLVVCGWGKLGGVRGKRMLEIIRDAGKVPHALKLNADGSPQHPLYLPRHLRAFPMPGFS
jgi:hypothetical protein